MFTDIVGSTALKQELGDGLAVRLIQVHHARVRRVLDQFRDAEEIDTAGDSFLVVFARPSDAVRFALELQHRLGDLAQEQHKAVWDRVGIHVGEVIIEERGGASDLYGMQVDVAARVMGLAGARQILMTRFAFDSARQVLRGEEVAGREPLRWLNHGPYLLKGVEEPVEICEVRLGGAEAVTPPGSTEKAQRYAAPGQEPVLGWRPEWARRCRAHNGCWRRSWGRAGLGRCGWDSTGSSRSAGCSSSASGGAGSVVEAGDDVVSGIEGAGGGAPHVVRLLEVNLEEAPYYLEEEYVAGRDLRTWCNARGGVEKVPLEERLEIVAQAAEGLAVGHTAGMIHRDIKPGNVLLAGGLGPRGGSARPCRPEPAEVAPTSSVPEEVQSVVKPAPSTVQVKLTDFGIGQVVSAEYLAGVTVTGFTQTIASTSSSSHTGTHMYMAPEVVAGRPTSAQSDIYSLGVVLYQLLAGDLARPVTIDSVEEIADLLLREDLRHCLGGKPEERFGSAAELARNLRTLPERRALRAGAAKKAFERGAAPVASIAVLPFMNMSADPENEFLSDGIAEDLLTALSRVPGLRVPGRTSCFVFKGKTQDLRAIGQALDVETVLEGSVRKAGNRLRITAQLINVADGYHLWSERYDREMADVFAIQDAITQAIMGALKVRLAAERPAILVKPGADQVERTS